MTTMSLIAHKQCSNGKLRILIYGVPLWIKCIRHSFDWIFIMNIVKKTGIHFIMDSVHLYHCSFIRSLNTSMYVCLQFYLIAFTVDCTKQVVKHKQLLWISTYNRDGVSLSLSLSSNKIHSFQIKIRFCRSFQILFISEACFRSA